MANSGKTAPQMKREIAESTERALNVLYGLMKPGQPMEYDAGQLGEVIGTSKGVADDRSIELTRLGILTRTINYGRHLPDGTWKIGRFAMWELHKSYAEAQALVQEWAKKLMAGEVKSVAAFRSSDDRKVAKKPKGKDPTNYKTQPKVAPGGPVEHIKPVVATSDDEEVRAIAGPEAPSPFEKLRPLRKVDDATALIAAARQYANRGDKMQDHIAALQATAKELGIEIDADVLMTGIKLERDERLETIALILPVIDKLERDNARLVSGMADQNQKAKDAEALAIDNRRLRARVEALVSERVVNSQRAQA